MKDFIHFALFTICLSGLVLLTGCSAESTQPIAKNSQSESQSEESQTEGDSSKDKSGEPENVEFTDRIVELSCGQCKLGLEGKGCDLAVRIEGKSYFVDGSGIDDHGDAHADDGLCNCIRKAKVTGQIQDGRFVATSIKILPAAK